MTTYRIYEGARESRDVINNGLTLREAKQMAKQAVQNAKDMGFSNYVAHIIKNGSGEFVHTEEFNFYEGE